jgi:hypothetical protein
MDALEWLRKHLEDDGSDLLRDDQELRRAADGREGQRAVRRRLRRAEPGAGQQAQRLPRAGLRHPGGHDPAVDPEAAPRQLPPRLAARTPRRAEQALTQVVCQCYIEGVSTRRVDDIVKALGIEGISKSQVSAMARTLDATVEAFRTRPLDAGPYTHVWLDGLTMKVREAAASSTSWWSSPPL